MATRTIPCEAAAKLRLQAENHLSVSGWDQPQIQIRIQDEAGLQVRQENGGWWIHCEEDAVLQVPRDSQIQVDYVHGSMSAINLKGEAKIENVGGHLTLRDVGDVRCGNVGGHLKVFQVNGNLVVTNIGGNLKGGEIKGALKVENTGGSIKLLDVCRAETLRAGGSIKVKLLELSNDLQASAGGSIKLWLPIGSSYQLDASSGGERIVFQEKGQAVKQVTHRFDGTIGEGGVRIRLAAGGSIVVLEGDWEEEGVEEEIGIRLDGLGDQIARRIQEKMQRAEERIRTAQERTERAASRRAGRGDFLNIGGMSFNFEGQAAAPPKRASEEERLIILNLLKEKKITAEEANRLLDALEGKFSER
ncbi:MAG: SHOCT-like domain-containing protein [Bellilinea sp.]